MQNNLLFGRDAGETLPDRFFYSHKAWDAYMADVWRGLLAAMPLAAGDTVIEAGCGNSVKIGSALAKLGFKGTLYLVDPFKEALLEAKTLYAALLPDARIHAVARTLADAVEELPASPACLVSNHALDDMLLALGRGSEDVCELFGWTAIEHEQTIALTQRVWSSLAADAGRLARVKYAVFEEWRAAIEALTPACCIISQYPSVTLSRAGMDSLNHHAAGVFTQLQRHFSAKRMAHTDIQLILNDNINYRDAHIGAQVLNAKNWMVLK